MASRTVVELDGDSLEIDDVIKISRGECYVKLSEKAEEKVKASRNVVDGVVKDGTVVYGINTGFGALGKKTISPHQLDKLQENLIKSHAAGVGPPLSPPQTRILMALRINVLAKGNSGIRLETLKQFVAALNADCLSYIPAKGTVGASGDLAPLAHLTLGLMGEGRMWNPTTLNWDTAANVLSSHHLKKIELKAKEGLALINGTQLITGLGLEALHRAELIGKQANVVAALSLEGLRGHPGVFDEDIHATRLHKGQNDVAKTMRALLDRRHYDYDAAADLEGDHGQDSYCLRCIPQVHGVVIDTIEFVRGILKTEVNSTLDNPIVLAETTGTISKKTRQHPNVKSCGNFHGEYPAKAMDYLAIAVHELGNISERRTEVLTNDDCSQGLPGFLVPKSKDDGLNSGFMIAQYTAAALVSENKVLTHPSSVDSIPTSANQENHVSMGGFAARKALSVVEHVEQVLAIELLAACQALDLRKDVDKKKTTTPPLEKVHKLVRDAGVSKWEEDRVMATDIEIATELLKNGMVWETVKPYVDAYN